MVDDYYDDDDTMMMMNAVDCSEYDDVNDDNDDNDDELVLPFPPTFPKAQSCSVSRLISPQPACTYCSSHAVHSTLLRELNLATALLTNPTTVRNHHCT